VKLHATHFLKPISGILFVSLAAMYIDKKLNS
jgi:hypothetical protein